MAKKEFDSKAFKMKFRAFFATLSFLSIMALIFCVIFFKAENIETLKYVLSFLLGSLLTAVITFYFDGNEIQGDNSDNSLTSNEPLLKQGNTSDITEKDS